MTEDQKANMLNNDSITKKQKQMLPWEKFISNSRKKIKNKKKN